MLPNATDSGNASLFLGVLPTPEAVVWFPTRMDLAAMVPLEHEARTEFFLLLYGVVLLAFAVLTDLVQCVCLCCVNRRSYQHVASGDEPRAQPLTESWFANWKRANKQNDRLLFTVFCVYRVSYMYGFALLVFYALQTERLDSRTGLAWEFYGPWLAEAVVSHIACLVVLIYNASMDAGEPGKDTKFRCCGYNIFITLMPFLSVRFDSFKDMITAGLMIWHSTTMSYFCALVVGVASIYCTFSELAMLDGSEYLMGRSWPIIKRLLDGEDHEVEAVGDELKEGSDERVPLVRMISGQNGSPFLRKVSKAAAEQTRDEAVRAATYMELPQAIASLMFMISQDRYCFFMILCLFFTVVKAFLLKFSRRIFIAYLTTCQVSWRNPGADDFTTLYAVLTTWSTKNHDRDFVAVMLNFIENPASSEMTMVSALKALGNLPYKGSTGTSWAACDVHNTDMMKALDACSKAEQNSRKEEGSQKINEAARETLRKMSSPDVIREQYKTNLRFKSTDTMTRRAQGYLDLGKQNGIFAMKTKLREDGILKAAAPLCLDSAPGSPNTLVIFYTDMESDDVCAIAQLWQLKVEMKAMQLQPLIVFHVDFNKTGKDNDANVFVGKCLIAWLILGDAEFHVMAQGDDNNPCFTNGSKQREDNMGKVRDRIANFPGEAVHFYILAPGCGNLGGIIDGSVLKQKQVRVSMYSGAFNMRGMTYEDLAAIGLLSEKAREGKKHLVDISKFLFFGGERSHRRAESFSTFASTTLDERICQDEPLLAASWKLFNQHMNKNLVNPSKIFDEKAYQVPSDRKEELNMLFHAGDMAKYCDHIVNNTDLFMNTRNFKKSTIVAFALDGLDSPLCDQLVFLHEWLALCKVDYLKQPEGMWYVDLEKGNTRVDLKAKDGRTKAIQPVLKEPLNAEVLEFCAAAMQRHLLQHLRQLGTSPRQ